jgi:acetylornithine deacetylase/succinyl-diaminopimelate desuccinylase-like protein
MNLNAGEVNMSTRRGSDPLNSKQMPGATRSATASAVAELAESRGLRDCLQWFTREKQWINDRHLELCRIPAPTFLEQKRAEWMAGQFRQLGWEADIDGAGNVLARSGRDSGSLVALTAHLDTVLAPRRDEDITVDGEGKFRGAGVSDNGAGLAALLAVAHALKACPAIEGFSDLLLVANVGEEGEGNLSGMRYLARQSALGLRIRAYLVLDGPSLDHITSRALASRRFEISFSGAGGHSWSDYGNANPVHAISHAISWFTERCTPLHTNGSGPRSSFNFGTIEGGSSINSIPVCARAKVDVRSEENRRIDELVEVLAESVERARETENQRATGARLTAKLKEIGSRPAGQLPEEAPLLAYLRAVDAHLGIRARLDCASTDANVPLSMGVPGVSIGAGGQGGGAHTPAEWYHPEGRDLGLKRILLTLALLLRCGETP